MARYVLLRIEDNNDADQLLADLTLGRGVPLLTPGINHPVYAELVHCIRESDQGMYEANHGPLRAISPRVRDSYDRGHELAATWSHENFSGKPA